MICVCHEFTQLQTNLQVTPFKFLNERLKREIRPLSGYIIHKGVHNKELLVNYESYN